MHLAKLSCRDSVCGSQAGKAAKKVKAESETEDMSGSEEDFIVKPKV